MITSVLEVTCLEDGSTELPNVDVAASADGVHVSVDNRAGEAVSLNGMGRDFSAGVTEQVAQIPPGDHEIACWPLSMHEGDEPPRQTIHVLDPDERWVPPELSCPKGQPTTGSATLDYGIDTPGKQGDPVDLALEVLRGVEGTDEIVAVGYPEAEFRQVALIRDEEQIALLSYSPTDDGGWLLAGYSACDPSSIDV